MCPTCDATNPETSRFCAACGSRLSSERPSGLRKRATILFCDVVGSSQMGERLDPEVLQTVMSRYFVEMRSILERHGGTVEKFIGDAVMAVFGVPVTHEDDPLRALGAAVEMCDAVSRLSDDLRGTLQIGLEVRIGVNTGEVMVGDPTTGHTFVAGDTVNTAARLQQTADPGRVVLSDSTFQLARRHVVAEPLEPLSLRGKSAPQAAWRLERLIHRDPWGAFDDATPFVGRAHHLTALCQALERVVADRSCCLFTVYGEPGVGKSRLVHEFVRSLPERLPRLPVATVVGHCLAYGGSDSLGPIVEMIGEIAGAHLPHGAPAPRPPDGTLARAGEVIAHGLVEGSAVHSTGETWWAVRKTFEGAAEQRSLVAVFEDVQWGKQALLDLIEHLADWSSGRALLLVCVARTELVDDRPTWAGGKLNTVSMLLPPLTRDESLDLVGAFGEVVLHAMPSWLPEVLEAAGGNPLYLEQMLLAGPPAEAGGPVVPPTVEGVVAARLDRLPAAERTALERAAVIGPEFPLDLLGRLLGSDPEALRGLVAALTRRRLVESFTINGGPPRHRFRNVTIREVVYRSMPRRTQAELHLRTADLLVEQGGGDEASEVVARHLEQAHQRLAGLGAAQEALAPIGLRAAAQFARAGLRSLSRIDLGHAADLLERSVALFPAGSPGRLESLTRLAEALMAAGEESRAEAVLGQLIDEGAGDRGSGAYGLLYRAALRAGGEGFGPLRDAAERAATAFTELRDERGLAIAWLRLGQAHGAEGRYAASAATLERALPLVTAHGSRLDEANMLGGLAMALWQGPASVGEAVDRCERLLHGLAEGGRAARAAVAGPLAVLAAMSGRFDDARRLAADTELAVSEMDSPMAIATAPVFTACVESLAGRWEAAEERLRASCQAFQRARDRGLLSWATQLLAHVLIRQERYDEAWEAARLARDCAADADIVTRAGSTSAVALVLGRRGDREEALALVESAMADAGATDSINVQAAVLLTRAEVLAGAGRRSDAALAAGEAVRRFGAKGNLVERARAADLLAEMSR
jgi:class 3 adenylate cyclase/tetratricopeptide (TPR) repeat protein